MTIRRRPIFIGFLGFWLALSCAVGLLLPPWLVIGHFDSYSVNGVPATRDEFLNFAMPLIPWLGALAAFSGVTSWLILTERSMGRPFAVALILLLATGSVLLLPGLPLAASWSIVFVPAVVVGLPLLWYFYRKRNVAEYYAELIERQGSSRPTA